MGWRLGSTSDWTRCRHSRDNRPIGRGFRLWNPSWNSVVSCRYGIIAQFVSRESNNYFFINSVSRSFNSVFPGSSVAKLVSNGSETSVEFIPRFVFCNGVKTLAPCNS